MSPNPGVELRQSSSRINLPDGARGRVLEEDLSFVVHHDAGARMSAGRKWPS